MREVQPAGAAVAALRLLGPALLAVATTWLIDQRTARRGWLPPGFRSPWRRGLAAALLAVILYLAVFGALGLIGLDVQPDTADLSIPRLFLLQGLMAGALAGWLLLGFAGFPGFWRDLAAQLGFRARSVWREMGIGLLLGAGAWAVVLVALILLALAVLLAGGEGALPKQPPAVVLWIAALPAAVRLAVSLSAGLVEETFFRGFLLPRVGIVMSTAMFALAHLAYGQPFLVIGVTILALIYAFVVRWRQTVWPAVAAHALFDGVQLLVIVPLANHMSPGGGSRTLPALAAVLPMLKAWGAHP